MHSPASARQTPSSPSRVSVPAPAQGKRDPGREQSRADEAVQAIAEVEKAGAYLAHHPGPDPQVDCTREHPEDDARDGRQARRKPRIADQPPKASPRGLELEDEQGDRPGGKHGRDGRKPKPIRIGGQGARNARPGRHALEMDAAQLQPDRRCRDKDHQVSDRESASVHLRTARL